MMSTKDHKYGHTKAITSLCLFADKSHFLTGSLDKLAKLWDTRTLTLLKSYSIERPVNTVTMSPLLDHIEEDEKLLEQQAEALKTHHQKMETINSVLADGS